MQPDATAALPLPVVFTAATSSGIWSAYPDNIEHLVDKLTKDTRFRTLVEKLLNVTGEKNLTKFLEEL